MNSMRSWWSVLTLSAFAWLLLTAAPRADAQTTVTVSYKEVHYQFEGSTLGLGEAAEGHRYGVWVRRGVTIFDGGEVAAYTAVGDVDITRGSGGITGFDTTYFADGSTWSTKFKGTFSIGPNGLWVIPHEGQFVKGTGRFAGITGTLVYTSRQVDKRPEFAGFAETEGTATYTLPPK